MQPTVDGIVSVSAVLRSHANPLFAGRLQADVGTMRTRWASVIETSRQHTARLTAAVDDTRATFDRIAALEAWLDDVTHTHLTREYTVHSDAELQQFTGNFQVPTSAHWCSQEGCIGGGGNSPQNAKKCIFKQKKIAPNSFIFFLPRTLLTAAIQGSGMPPTGVPRRRQIPGYTPMLLPRPHHRCLSLLAHWWN